MPVRSIATLPRTVREALAAYYLALWDRIARGLTLTETGFLSVRKQTLREELESYHDKLIDEHGEHTARRIFIASRQEMWAVHGRFLAESKAIIDEILEQ